MKSRREFSPRTLSVLAALFQEPSRWQHRYALASQTGLRSGTLYPILIRLADRGLVEACWQGELRGRAGRAGTCTGSRPAGWPARRGRWPPGQGGRGGTAGGGRGAAGAGRGAADRAGCGGARGAMSWLGRAGARLVPAGRRDWAEAVWAEAREVPAAWPRLAWPGGAWLIAREAQMVHRTGTLLLFTAAAGAATWSAWPASAVSHAATARADIIATVLLLAALPLLARWFLGPPDNRAARWLRAGGYAAILAIMQAKAAILLFNGTVPRGGPGLHAFHVLGGHGVPGSVSVDPSVAGDIAILVLTACGLAVILALTARRTRVAPATLAIGPGTGLALGAAMHAVDPLGVNRYVTAPWLRGTWTDQIPAGPAQSGGPGLDLAVRRAAGRRGDRGVALSCAGRPGRGVRRPGLAGFRRGAGVRRRRRPVRHRSRHRHHRAAGQVGLAAGLAVPGQHLTATVVYGREVFATGNLVGYFGLLVAFPFIGLMMGLTGAGCHHDPPAAGRRQAWRPRRPASA